MITDLSWLGPEDSKKLAEISWNGAKQKVPLAGEMDFIRALKDVHGALRTWPKKSLEARWDIFAGMISSFKEDSGEIFNLMIAEKGDQLGRREHAEFLKALDHFKLEDFLDAGVLRKVPAGITAVFLDERHPWVSWILWVATSMIHGNAVVVRFVPENVRAATYLHHKLPEWGVPKGLLSLFVSQDEDFEKMVCSHPAVASVLVECAEWDKANYKKVLSGSWKKFAILSETRPVVLLLQESSPELAGELVQKSLSPGFGFERLGRAFTLDKYFDGWAAEIKKAAEGFQVEYPWQRPVRQEKWHLQRAGLLAEKGVVELGESALMGLDFSNCSAFQQQVLHGPFLSLTRSKYVHEAIKFAQTTPLKSHITLWGPEEKMSTWSQGLGFQHIWCNRWPTWSLEGLLRSSFSDESYFVGAEKPGGVFYSLQQINSLYEAD